MTHDERISSYIDNELSSEQEQEFLISLAASDGLRKSFRSELVMKNIMHKSEPMPPRRMRGVVFAAVGIGAASTIAGEHTATAATKSTASLVKSMFATKIGAIVTASVVGTSAIVGYGVRTMTEPSQVAPVSHATPAVVLPAQTNTATQVAEVPQSSQVSDRHQHGVTVKHGAVSAKSSDNAKTAKSPTGPVNTVVGGGQISITPATVDTK
jgi:hypothetical protein